ncbi:hypothetical protein BYT27DRAFT_6596587 [Phlegmacium glaucopus]|nr:hypothetical protein BYT27DRAFT_6596587 [Phlegmacium glaucopus]
MLRLLWSYFLVFYHSKPSTCPTLHPSPIPSHPHSLLGGDDHFSVVPCLAAWPIHRHRLVLRQFLKIEQTLSMADALVTILHCLLISMYICIMFYTIPSLLMMTKRFYLPRLPCLDPALADAHPMDNPLALADERLMLLPHVFPPRCS